jgi:alkanesulfonate monooxygenase SsuD/methylene tetrahydromethanopterin reductase-like flavin-dependent oxidoreductase (luciferase family)
LGGAAEYGAHLPLADLGSPPSLASRKAYARAANGLGYSYLCVTDHLLFTRPWLDGPTALAAVIEESGSMRLATTVSLPVLRGPVPLAKKLTALDVLSNGQLLAALGPGSSAKDYAAVGVPFSERWRRFDDSVPVVRALLRGDREASTVVPAAGCPVGRCRAVRIGMSNTPPRFRLSERPAELPHNIPGRCEVTPDGARWSGPAASEAISRSPQRAAASCAEARNRARGEPCRWTAASRAHPVPWSPGRPGTPAPRAPRSGGSSRCPRWPR